MPRTAWSRLRVFAFRRSLLSEQWDIADVLDSIAEAAEKAWGERDALLIGRVRRQVKRQPSMLCRPSTIHSLLSQNCNVYRSDGHCVDIPASCLLSEKMWSIGFIGEARNVVRRRYLFPVTTNKRTQADRVIGVCSG